MLVSLASAILTLFGGDGDVAIGCYHNAAGLAVDMISRQVGIAAYFAYGASGRGGGFDLPVGALSRVQLVRQMPPFILPPGAMDATFMLGNAVVPKLLVTL